jgi:hypothetical protein
MHVLSIFPVFVLNISWALLRADQTLPEERPGMLGHNLNSIEIITAIFCHHPVTMKGTCQFGLKAERMGGTGIS